MMPNTAGTRSGRGSKAGDIVPGKTSCNWRREAQVQQLFLFHHDPAATDEHLNERQFLAQQLFPQTFVAREGLKIPLHSARRG